MALLLAASSWLGGCGGSGGGGTPVTAHVEVRLAPFLGEVRPGDVLDFGLSSGATSLEVRVTNVGTSALSLAPMTLTGDTRDFRVEIPQTGSIDASAAPAPAVDFPYVPVGLDPAGGRILAPLAAASPADGMDALQGRSAVTLRGVPIPGGDDLDLRLSRVALPFAEDAVVVVDGRPLETSVEAWLGELSLWRGSVAGVEGSSAFLGFSAAGVNGWIELPDEVLHVVACRSAGGETIQAVVSERDLRSSVRGQPGCLAALRPPTGGAPAPSDPSGAGRAELADVDGFLPPVCRVAVETDAAFSWLFGSSSAAAAYAASLFAAVAEQFRTELQTDLELAYLALYSSSSEDPWESPRMGGDAEDLLLEFENAWNRDGWPVEANLAHFLSGANLGGGIAYIDVLCDRGFGYGVSSGLSGAINWNVFDGRPSVFNWDYFIVAHEIGHGLGAQHTNEYCPPLDRCAENCDGFLRCGSGTVMSNCHQCTGGVANIGLHYHAETANLIRREIATSCLGRARLQPGASFSLLLTLAPTSGPGPKRATLNLAHDGQGSPFQVVLAGEAAN